jgi:hypothetical protein
MCASESNMRRKQKVEKNHMEKERRKIHRRESDGESATDNSRRQ